MGDYPGELEGSCIRAGFIHFGGDPVQENRPYVDGNACGDCQTGDWKETVLPKSSWVLQFVELAILSRHRQFDEVGFHLELCFLFSGCGC